MPTLENSRTSRVRLKKTLEISENFRVGQKNLRELQKVFEFFASLQENYLTFKQSQPFFYSRKLKKISKLKNNYLINKKIT